MVEKHWPANANVMKLYTSAHPLLGQKDVMDFPFKRAAYQYIYIWTEGGWQPPNCSNQYNYQCSFTNLHDLEQHHVISIKSYLGILVFAI